MQSDRMKLTVFFSTAASFEGFDEVHYESHAAVRQVPDS
jgi:hypothetical protein